MYVDKPLSGVKAVQTLSRLNRAHPQKLATFLNFLIPKLPAPREDDLSKGILEAIDMESYRAEVQSAIAISLPDQDVEIGPVPTEAGGYIREQQMDYLSNIVRTFNDHF